MTAKALRHPPLAVEDAGGRGARWLLRHAGRPVPRFDDLALRSRWDALDADARDRALAVAALLDARPAIDRELTGARLAPLSGAVGEALFDAVLDSDVTGDELALPDASELGSRGALLSAAMAEGDVRARELIDRAAALVAGA